MWQNWVCGSIGGSPRTGFGFHVWRKGRWARLFQAPTLRITVEGHWYLHSKNRFTGNYLEPICCVGLRKSRGGVLSAGPGKQGIGDGDGLGSTGTTDTDAGRHHCGETRPPKELRRKSLCRYQWLKGVVPPPERDPVFSQVYAGDDRDHVAQNRPGSSDTWPFRRSRGVPRPILPH